MKEKIDISFIILLSFILYLMIGVYITGDFIVTPDEPLHRINGFISLKYILNLLNISDVGYENLNTIPDLHNDWRKTYGVLFDLPFAAYEYFFNIDTKNIFLQKHYANFLIFYISTIFFYKISLNITSNKFLSLIGVIFLISTPRIFSHSFYNSKDVLFLSLIIISIYFCIKLIQKVSLKYLFLSAVFCAFASSIRIVGIYLPLLTLLFLYFKNQNKKDKFSYLKILLFYFSFLIGCLYIVYPFLWNDPIINFLTILKESTTYPNHWDFNILYFGNYINPENLPWHYFFVWFLMTTPIFFIILILLGLINFLKDYLPFFLKIDFKKISLWNNKTQMVSLFIFLNVFIPLFFVITLNSTLYNGWRHLYFVYPSMILLFIIYFKEIMFTFQKVYKIFLIMFFFQCISNFYFIYKVHPLQNIYFNHISKSFINGNFPIDYWGLGNKKTIDYLLERKKNFSISTSSYIQLENLKYYKSETNYTNIIDFKGTQEIDKKNANYIFTNYFYNKNPTKVKKYQIPSDYKSYYKLKIGNIVVNEVFSKQ